VRIVHARKPKFVTVLASVARIAGSYASKEAQGVVRTSGRKRAERKANAIKGTQNVHTLNLSNFRFARSERPMIVCYRSIIADV